MLLVCVVLMALLLVGLGMCVCEGECECVNECVSECVDVGGLCSVDGSVISWAWYVCV